MADRRKHGVRVLQSDCENLLECNAEIESDKPGKVSTPAGLCLCTDYYDHPIYECGIHPVDMAYLQRPL